MKKQRKTLFTLCVALMLSVLVAAGGFAVFATDNSYETRAISPVKSLVSTGKMGDGEVEWGGTGAPGDWDWELEEIKDSSQSDGGDVILRHTLNEDGTVKEAGNFGFSRQSSDASKAAYGMEGLTIKFYAAASDFMFIFTANSGWYNVSPCHFALWFKLEKDSKGNLKHTIKLSAAPDGGELGNWISGTGRKINYDYVYENDSTTEGYQIKYGDAETKPEFTGTINTVEIKPSVTTGKSNNGHYYVVVNGQNSLDLDTRGVVSDVISKFSQHGGFITVWQTGTSAQAIKITDIYNNRTEWKQTAPNNVELLSDAGTAEFGKDDKCATAVRTPAAGGGEYTVRHSANESDRVDPKKDGLYQLYMRDLSMKLRYGEGNTGDVINVRLRDIAVDSQKYVNMAFKKTGASKAELTVSTVNGETAENLGTVKDVSFSFNGTSINNISLRDTVGLELLVNGKAVNVDYNKLDAFISSFESEKAYAEFAVKETKQSVLSLVKLESKKVETFESVDGFTATGNVTIKSDDKYSMFYNAVDEAFTVTYDKNKIIADSFEIEYRLGKYGNKSKGFRISALDENGVGVAVNYAYASETTATVSVKAIDGNNETSFGSEEMAFDWDYASGNKTLGFVKSGRSGYLTFIDGDIAVAVDSESDMAALDAIVTKMSSKTVNVKFEAEAEAKTAFALIDYKYHVHTVLAPGWQVGAVNSTDFGYSDSNSVVLAFGGHSYIKTKSVLLDGFGMNLKSYAKSGNSAPTFVLANSSSWYSDNVAIQFGIHKVADTEDKAHFILAYSNSTEGEYQFVKVAANENITEFEVNWNWNNGKDNVISLSRTDNVWRWIVNGAVLTPADNAEVDYSDIYNELYPMFTADDHTAVMQAWSGNNMVFNLSQITEYEPNVDPEVTAAPKFEAQKKGAELTLDLTKVFTDSNGDALTFTLADETDAYQGEINGNIWTFNCDKAGTYNITVYAVDGRGGIGECTFTVTVKEDAESSGCGCGSEFSASAAVAACVLFAAAVIALAARRRQKTL